MLELETLSPRWARSADRVAHWMKRLEAGDLAPGTTQEEYYELLVSVCRDLRARIYADERDPRVEGSLAIVGVVAGQKWLVKVNGKAELLTGFPPENATRYLHNPRYRFLGTVEQVRK